MNIGERIQRARKARGLSLVALGNHVGVSHTAIDKYEKNINIPNSQMLIKLAEVLSLSSIEYFFRPIAATFEPSFRKKSVLSAVDQNAIVEQIQEKAERRIELEMLLDWGSYHVPKLDSLAQDALKELDDVEKVVDELRDSWELGSNAIPHLVNELEKQGILVFYLDREILDVKFDGLAGHVEGHPVVAVCTNHNNGDRQRFTLAHELGHLLLDPYFEDKKIREKYANRFAGAFLLPREEAYRFFSDKRKKISIPELVVAKKEYGISIQAILYRLRDLEIISKAEMSKWYAIMNKNGWRTKEPGGAIPLEETNWFESRVYRAYAEEHIGQSKSAELLGISLSEFREKLEEGLHEWADSN